MNKVSETDLAFAAGLIDSDGSIALWEGGRDSGKNGVGWQCVVGFAQVKPDNVRWMHALFGGKYYEQKAASGSVVYKCVFRSSGPVRSFLSQIAPYLRMKQRQAELCLQFLETKHKNVGRKGLPPDTAMLRSVLSRKVTRLNKAVCLTPDYNKSVALVEKFESVQGEGRNSGRASIFIRLAGCNLQCVFADGSLCDTPWGRAKEKTTVRELRDYVERAAPVAVNDVAEHPDERYMVVITGGEPTMSPAFDDVVYALKAGGYYVAVETNGTIWRDALYACDWVTVSPKDKIKHDKPLHKPTPENRGVIGGVHDKVANLFPDEYRFVITGKDAEVPVYLPGLTHYVSPALEADGTGTEHLSGKPPRFVPGAVERCIEIVQADPRWRISLQSHKWLMVR